MVKNFFPGLRRRRGGSGSFGDAIPATRARQMLAVAQKGFSFAQGHFLLCPINVTPQTVGDVGLSVVCKTNHARTADGKPCVVCGDDSFTFCRLQKFAAGVRPARNNRIGINGSVRVERRRWRESSIVPIPGRRQRGGIGWDTRQRVIRRRGVRKGPEEEGEDYAQ
jgi:hypothetical protein